MDSSSLADNVIRANEEERRQREDTGPRLDDVGFPLPEPDTERAWCEYLTARLLYLNPRMYLYLGYLWIDDDPIKEDKNNFYELAHYTKNITDPQCRYVWRRAKEMVPKLSIEEMAVLPDTTFNTRTGKVEHKEVWTTKPWKEEDDVRY